MKIGFNAEAIAKLGKNKLIKDTKGKIKTISFDDQTANLIKKLREDNHESYIFITTNGDLSLDEKKKIKNNILKKYKLDKKFQPRIVIVNKKDYQESINRNGISIEIGANLTKYINEELEIDKVYQQLDKYIQDEILDLSKPIMDSNVESCGIPSKDKFWLKHHTKEAYKFCDDLSSPYERITKGNIDFLDEIFIEDSNFGTRMTYEEVFEKADKLCEVFLANGIKKGSKVPLILTSTPEMFITILALFKAKATIVPLFPKSTENEIKTKLESIEYDYMIVNDLFYKSVKNSIKDNSKAIILPVSYSASPLKKVYFNNIMMPKLGCEKVNYNEQFISFDDFIKNSPKYNGFIDTSYDEEYEAVQLFTGGTVKSKGVILTSKNLEAAFQGYPIANYPVLRDDKFACFLPINHVFGLVSIIYSASAYGGKLSTMLKINFKKIHELFLKDKITIFAGIPTMIDSILNSKKLKGKDLEQLRYVILGGAKTVDQVKKNIKQFGLDHGCDLEVVDGLGQTEVSTAYLYNNILSVNDEVKIINTETGEELGYNQVGEICISGPNVMKGYVMEEDNLSAFEKDENGKVWFHTGDVGYNNNGKIYHTGRLNRRIKVNGELICVEDLEAVISQFDAIKDCCVVGKTDLRKENIPVAFITLKDGYKYDEYTKKCLEAYYSENIVYYSRPAITKCLNELPKTTIGKPDFKQLQLLADCMEIPSEKLKIKK